MCATAGQFADDAGRLVNAAGRVQLPRWAEATEERGTIVSTLVGFFWAKWLLDLHKVEYTEADLEEYEGERGLFREKECGEPRGVKRVESCSAKALRMIDCITHTDAGASSADVRKYFE